jgi:hypothetical protein
MGRGVYFLKYHTVDPHPTPSLIGGGVGPRTLPDPTGKEEAGNAFYFLNNRGVQTSREDEDNMLICHIDYHSQANISLMLS